MQSVITFIGEQISLCLKDIILELKANHALLADAKWLCPDYALDLPFSELHPGAAQAIAKRIIGTHAIDCYAQPLGQRRKKLLVADMDSTMITSETMDDIAKTSPHAEEIREITQLSVAGTIDFAEGLRRRVKLLQGMDGDIFQQVRDSITFSEGAKTLLRTLRHGGCYTALVSGGFHFFADYVGYELGFDHVLANDLPIRDGKITLALKEPILDSAAKATLLRQMATDRGLHLKECAAIGDGSNDIPMLKIAGLGCAYRGKPLVKDQIPCQLNFADCTGLLYYQGYHREEFAA